MPKKQTTISKNARAAARDGEKYTLALRQLEIDAEIPIPAVYWCWSLCANCDRSLDSSNRRIYCHEGCGDIAGGVRYIRKKLADGDLTIAQVRYGVISDEDLAKAVYNDLRFYETGGYRGSTSSAQRTEVLARYGGKCAQCEKRATDVDHVLGGRQPLCPTCHDSKTQRESPEGARLAQQGTPTSSWSVLLRELVRTSEPVRALLKQRILPRTPVRPCDDHTLWRHLQPRVSSERRRQLTELLDALFDGDVPRFSPGTTWQEKMRQAREYHSEWCDDYDDPCEVEDCPEHNAPYPTPEDSGRSSYKAGNYERDDYVPSDYPSHESWLDDVDVHAGYGPGSYFAHAMAKED
jgi:hypothetical protein